MQCKLTNHQGFKMKLMQLLALTMGLALATAPLARAQETETPTDKASPTPAEKTETKKSDEETKPEGEKTEKTDAEKSATPVAKSAQKKEKPAAARSMARGSVDAQLKDIENRWEAAFQSRDVKVVEEILADSYVLTDENGKVLNRRGALKKFKKETDKPDKTANSDVVVHAINQDAAVVTGMSRESGKDKSGKMFERSYRWTDTFVNHNGKWQCVASHVTLVAQK
jgi:ketosteroid isomerase-like protein